VITFSFDDGRFEDFADQTILGALGIPATFYLTVGHLENADKLKQYYNGLSLRDVCDNYSRFPFEVGCHGWQHLNLGYKQGIQAVVNETITAKLWLSRIFNQQIDHYAFPYGIVSAENLNRIPKFAAGGFKTLRMFQVKYEYTNSAIVYPALISSVYKFYGKPLNKHLHIAGHGSDLIRLCKDNQSGFTDWVARMINEGHEFVTVSKFYEGYFGNENSYWNGYTE
jgi:peptidoglycan/xylan/chitin deacetylase (PgdA/CDA1 family)